MSSRKNLNIEYKGNQWEAEGNILSNGEVILSGNAVVNGKATGFGFSISDNAIVTKGTVQALYPKEFLPVAIPDFLEDLGELEVDQNQGMILSSGSYLVSEVEVEGKLFIDNSNGPVTSYVTGDVEIDETGRIGMADWDPEKFAIYVQGPQEVRLAGQGMFYGVVYAPESVVDIAGFGEFFGSFVGYEVLVSEYAQIHYDKALKKGEKPEEDKLEEEIEWAQYEVDQQAPAEDAARKAAEQAQVAASQAQDAATRAAAAVQAATKLVTEDGTKKPQDKKPQDKKPKGKSEEVAVTADVATKVHEQAALAKQYAVRAAGKATEAAHYSAEAAMQANAAGTAAAAQFAAAAAQAASQALAAADAAAQSAAVATQVADAVVQAVG